MRRPAVLLAVVALAAGVVPVALADSDHSRRPAIYLVGGAAESIDPTPAMIAGGDFYLGGFGFASGHPGNVTALPSFIGDRHATGVLTDGLDADALGNGAHTRALAVSDGSSTIVLSQIETQGFFNAYKQGPFGLNEIRQDAAAKIAADAAAIAAAGATGHGRPHLAAPVPTPSQILVDSDHSHGGADTAGVWGGVPTAYLKEVHDQTVLAIEDAWKSMQPAVLSYGVAHAGVEREGAQYPPQECIDAGGCDKAGNSADFILTNDFWDDPRNQTMDDEVRVLQARNPDTGDVIATYSNFSAHPTVLGGGNRLVTGDYPGRLSWLLGKTYGGFGMDQVATLGRTHSNHGACVAADAAVPGESDAMCQLDTFATRVLRKVQEALAKAQPFTGKPTVAMNSYLLNDPTTSGVLAGITYAGTVIGAPAGRAANAPWYTGSMLGTSVFSGRIGNVLINGGPGEMYPQIVQKVRDLVMADNPDGIKGVLNIGTAGDFLGYIIAPLEAYPCPAAASMVDGGCNQDTNPDPTRISPDPIGSDNYFFNISHTFGERLTCDLLRGAGDTLLGDSAHYWQQYDRCALFANDFALPQGQDTQFPQQPDLYDNAHPAFDHM